MAIEAQNPIFSFNSNKSELHIAVFPWLGFGHIIPFLELSKFLVQKGHKITFITTPRNIDRLPKIPPNLASSITLLKLHLPQTEGLPPNAEATMDVHPDDVPFLKKAYDGLEPELTSFLENSVPDMIIYDFASHWLPEAAEKLGIFRVHFSILPAWFHGFYGSVDDIINGTGSRKTAEDFTVPAPWAPFENKVAYRMYEIYRIFRPGQKNPSGVSDGYRAGMTIKGADAIIFRYCYEFEGEWLNLLNEIYKKPVIPVGLMPPELKANPTDESNESWISIKSFMENKTKGSVIYVALGSEVALSQQELTELALGLELSEIPFFWVFRRPAGASEIEIPEGFEERVKGRGVVWKTWAPQLKILSHESVGGFLTHCGWSSTIEGMMLGLPFIMLPFLVDQGLNARVLEDKEVGIEVPRNEEDGSYTKESVAESVRLIMVEKEGAKYREKAIETSKIYGDRKLHQNYLEKFSSMLVSGN